MTKQTPQQFLDSTQYSCLACDVFADSGICPILWDASPSRVFDEIHLYEYYKIKWGNYEDRHIRRRELTSEELLSIDWVGFDFENMIEKTT